MTTDHSNLITHAPNQHQPDLLSLLLEPCDFCNADNVHAILWIVQTTGIDRKLDTFKLLNKKYGCAINQIQKFFF